MLVSLTGFPLGIKNFIIGRSSNPNHGGTNESYYLSNYVHIILGVGKALKKLAVCSFGVLKWENALVSKELGGHINAISGSLMDTRLVFMGFRLGCGMVFMTQVARIFAPEMYEDCKLSK